MKILPVSRESGSVLVATDAVDINDCVEICILQRVICLVVVVIVDIIPSVVIVVLPLMLVVALPMQLDSEIGDSCPAHSFCRRNICKMFKVCLMR